MPTGFQSQRSASTTSRMAAMLAICGRRWALRVLWELRGGSLTFRALRDSCGGISPSVLQRRLHELRDFGVVEKIPRLGYRLSASGERLFPILAQLNKWAHAAPDQHAR